MLGLLRGAMVASISLGLLGAAIAQEGEPTDEATPPAKATPTPKASPTSKASPTAKASPTPKATPSAPASASTEPENTTAQYGDWQLHCAALPTGGRACEVQQAIEVKGKTVAGVAFGRPDPKSPLLATVVLPTNVSFPSIVLVSIDDKDDKALQLSWQQCLPGGCFARAELKPELIERWRGQTGTGIIRFLDAQKQPITLTFSFRGFATVIDNLNKSAPPQ